MPVTMLMYLTAARRFVVPQNEQIELLNTPRRTGDECLIRLPSGEIRRAMLFIGRNGSEKRPSKWLMEVWDV